MPCHCSPDLYKAVSEIQWSTPKPHKALHTQVNIQKNQRVSLKGSSIQEQGASLKSPFLTRKLQQWQWVETDMKLGLDQLSVQVAVSVCLSVGASDATPLSS